MELLTSLPLVHHKHKRRNPSQEYKIYGTLDKNRSKDKVSARIISTKSPIVKNHKQMRKQKHRRNKIIESNIKESSKKTFSSHS